MPEPLMTFGRRMTGLPEHILSGALACSPVFEDIRRNLESRGLAFALLDERRQYVWPLDRSRITRWEAPLESGTVVDAAAGPVYMTSQKLHAGLPQWTVVVTRPGEEQDDGPYEPRGEDGFLALGVLLLTSAAGWLACWPLSNALFGSSGETLMRTTGTTGTRLSRDLRNFAKCRPHIASCARDCMQGRFLWRRRMSIWRARL